MCARGRSRRLRYLRRRRRRPRHWGWDAGLVAPAWASFETAPVYQAYSAAVGVVDYDGVLVSDTGTVQAYGELLRPLTGVCESVAADGRVGPVGQFERFKALYLQARQVLVGIGQLVADVGA